ncbi:MAG: helix-turn-helix transcriptional regulator [Clostridia bacterium]|nr:helix-turn-helix transcriptional regulator [Clostridia bacterium]
MDFEKESILKDIGQRIQKYRTAKKLTQEQLADMTGISQKHISRLERGIHTPHFDMIIKIAKALDVSIDTFVEDLASDNTNIFLQNIKSDVTGMSQNQLSLIKEAILAIKKYKF